MKVKALLILIGSIIFLHSCAPTHVTKMAAVASSDQKIDYDGTISSKKRHFVSLSPYSELDVAEDRTMFMLSIENCGEDPINISYDDVSVVFEEDNGNRAIKRINVQKFDDFMNDLKEELSNKEKRFIQEALVDIKTFIEAACARSDSSSVFDNLLSSSDSGGSSLSDFSSSSSPILDNPCTFPLAESLSDSDKQKVEHDLEDLKTDIEVMRSNNKRLQAVLQEFFMQPKTIMPGNSYNGIVVCDTRDMNSEIEGHFQVAVSVDGEEHSFTFKRSLYKK